MYNWKDCTLIPMKELIAQVVMNVATIAIVMYVFVIQMSSIKADIVSLKQNISNADVSAKARTCLDTSKPNVIKVMNGSDICYCVSSGGHAKDAAQSDVITSNKQDSDRAEHTKGLAVPLTMDPDVANSLMNAVEEVSGNMQSVEPFTDFDETPYFMLQ